MDVQILYIYSAFILIFIQFGSALRCPDLNVRFGRVKYRSRGRVAIFGCWTGFTLYGEKYAGCFRGLWDVTPPKCVRKGCNEVAFNFGTVRKPLSSTAVLGFRCFQGYELAGPKEIYCDGSSYDTLPPICRRTETDVSCDFEDNTLCKWRNDPTQNLTFQLRRLATPSRILHTGPDHDHTLDPDVNGAYIYLESSSTVPGEAARIFTPYLPHAPNDNTCFKFWYHIYGRTIGWLRVFVNDTIVFERYNSRGDRWRLGKAKLPSGSHFKIIVEAATGRGYLGDIALDDFDMGECTDPGGKTCVDRCSDDESDPFASCNCHPGCVESEDCCGDFLTNCVAETTTEQAEVTTAPSELSTALEENTADVSAVAEEIEGKYEAVAFTDDDSTLETNTEIFLDHTRLTETDNESGTEEEPVDQTQIAETEYESDIETMAIAHTQIDTVDDGKVDESTSEPFTGDYEIGTQNIENDSSPNKDKDVILSTISISRSTNTDPVTNYTTLTTPRYRLRPRLTTPVSNSTTRTTLSTLPRAASQALSTTVATRPTTITTAIRLPLTSPTTKPTPIPTRRTTSKITTAIAPRRMLTTSTTLKTTPPTPKPPPIAHRPVTESVKDPKITSQSLPTFSTIQMPIVINVDSNPLVIFPTPTENLTDSGTDLQQPQVKKWKSKYKKKGAYQLVENKQTEEGTDVAGITSVLAFCLVFIVGSTIMVVLLVRKRRLSSGPCDGAEIVFIPADELLDFTPAGGNRDSGVYSDTVMSIKRDKAAKS